jgi:hypothetical protein
MLFDDVIPTCKKTFFCVHTSDLIDAVDALRDRGIEAGVVSNTDSTMRECTALLWDCYHLKHEQAWFSKIWEWSICSRHWC